jgi:hypothetical protein
LVIVVPFGSVICAKTTFAEIHDGRSSGYEDDLSYTTGWDTIIIGVQARKNGPSGSALRAFRKAFKPLR